MTPVLTPASLFRHLRDHGECTLHDLAEHFGVPAWSPTRSRRVGEPTPVSTPAFALIQAGLIRAEQSAPSGERAPYVLNPYNRVADARNVILQLVDAEAWRDIQAALSISLAELSAKQAGSAMVVSPVFGPPEPQRTTAPQSPDVLVLMPFVAEMALLYNEIRSVALRCNASVARADEFSGQGIVMQDTWTAICHAKLIVADCTGRNPNVFYEIGLAHAVGTPVLLIAQDVTDIPFDIQHHRVIPYRRDDLRSFRNTLEVNIRAELDDTSRDL